jgi:hypothetical protein
VIRIRVAASFRGMTVAPMPAGRGLLPLADVADRERSDGGPELVIGRKDAWLVSSRTLVARPLASCVTESRSSAKGGRAQYRSRCSKG